MLDKSDLIVLVIDSGQEVGDYELNLISKAAAQGVPVVGALNKIDINPDLEPAELESKLGIKMVPVSAITRQGIESLKLEMIKSAPTDWTAPTIVGDLINPGDTVVLVVPIDWPRLKAELSCPRYRRSGTSWTTTPLPLVAKERGLKKALPAWPKSQNRYY